MLTAKYRLHFANGKDHIKEERLRPYDKAKHEIYKALKEELSKAHSWDDLKEVLADRDIDMKFKSVGLHGKCRVSSLSTMVFLSPVQRSTENLAT